MYAARRRKPVVSVLDQDGDVWTEPVLASSNDESGEELSGGESD